jgi:transketolase
MPELAQSTLEQLSINTLRFLSADSVQQANSGHPGLPMGAAPTAYTIWTRHLRHNPANPAWPNRDRFVLSGGHGCMLLYSLLYLTGYDLSAGRAEALPPVGQPDARPPGVRPDARRRVHHRAPGSGICQRRWHGHRRGTPGQDLQPAGHEIIDHYVYAIVTDGDLMEGVASEAASLAGHLRLGKLIYLYDDNKISIEGSTDLAFTEDRGKRFEAYGWHVQKVADGLDVEAIDRAIQMAKLDPRPSLIMVPNIIGYGLPTRAGTAKAHGEPPGDAELNGAKENLGWPVEPRFYVPDEALGFFRQAVARGAEQEGAWREKLEAYHAEYPDPGGRAGAAAGRPAAGGLGGGAARVPAGCEGHGLARVFGQGDQCHRGPAP